MLSPVFSTKNLYRRDTGFAVIAGRNKRVVGKSSNSLNVNLVIYISSAVLAFSLFLPQVREFFSNIGWRWAHILCLSFSLSFCMNPVFRLGCKKAEYSRHSGCQKTSQRSHSPSRGGGCFYRFQCCPSDERNFLQTGPGHPDCIVGPFWNRHPG